MADPESIPPPRKCGAQIGHNAALSHNKTYRGNRRQIESYNKAYGRLVGRVGGREGIAVIPVVVHVLYNNPTDNISDELILSQLVALNRDFRKQNTDVSEIPPIWQGVAADAAIEFQLAVRDPNGNATTGITRKQVDPSLFVVNFDLLQTLEGEPLKYAVQGGQSPWDRDKYLNIWVCPMQDTEGGTIIGYAQFPGGSAETDGVVIRTDVFGIRPAHPRFNLGRTTTHEVGHWLDLYHIWGDDGQGCNGDDLVADTPNQGGYNSGKPTYPKISCNNAPHGDMFMNYMDYTDDDRLYMFTVGQVARMDAALLGPRSALLSSDGLMLPVMPSVLNGISDMSGVRAVMGIEVASVERTIRLKPHPVP